MLRRRRHRRRVTEGERCRALAFCAVALFGGGFAFLVVMRLNGERVLGAGLSWYELWVVISGTFGAAVALFLAGDRIGQPGLRGMIRMMPNMVWISFVGALIAGTLALPFYGTMFGPFILGVTLVGAPMLACLWFANLLAAHALLTVWHRERDSIFTMQRVTSAVRTGPAENQRRSSPRLAGRRL